MSQHILSLRITWMVINVFLLLRNIWLLGNSSSRGLWTWNKTGFARCKNRDCFAKSFLCGMINVHLLLLYTLIMLSYICLCEKDNWKILDGGIESQHINKISFKFPFSLSCIKVKLNKCYHHLPLLPLSHGLSNFWLVQKEKFGRKKDY